MEQMLCTNRMRADRNIYIYIYLCIYIYIYMCGPRSDVTREALRECCNVGCIMIGSYVDVVAIMLMASTTTITIAIVLMSEVMISIVVMVAIGMVASMAMMVMMIVTTMFAFVIVACTRETIMSLSGPVLFVVRVFLDGDQIAD
jgi:hypothetical protein